MQLTAPPTVQITTIQRKVVIAVDGLRLWVDRQVHSIYRDSAASQGLVTGEYKIGF